MKIISTATLTIGLLASFASEAFVNPIVDYLHQQFDTYVAPSTEDLQAAEGLRFSCDVFDANKNNEPRQTELTLRRWENSDIYAMTFVNNYLVYGSRKVPLDVTFTYMSLSDQGLNGTDQRESPSPTDYFWARVDPQDKTQLLVQVTRDMSDSRPKQLSRYFRCRR